MFVKFKEYMRDVKNNIFNAIYSLENALEFLNMWVFDFQKFVDMLKTTGFNDTLDALNDILGDLSKWDKETAKVQIKEHIEILKSHIYTCDSLIRAFDNEKAIGLVDDFPLFYVTLITTLHNERLTGEEVIKIFGSAVVFKSKKGGENKSLEDLWKCNFETLNMLSNYFDIYGNFQNGGDSDLFITLFNNLSKATRIKDFAFKNKELQNVDYIKVSDEFMTVLRHDYEEFLKKDISLSEKNEGKTEQQKEVREAVMVEYEKPEYEKLSFLSDENKNIYFKACNVIGSLIGRSDYNYYMEAILDIQSLEELYEDADKEYFDEIINEAIFKLKMLLNMFHTNEVSRDVELIFLNDVKGDCYFTDDLNKIDKGMRNKIDLLFEKIKSGNNHRAVLNDNLKAGELLFINGINLSISFCRIAIDTYLIIGIHSINDGFNQDINRYFLNKKYIEKLKELVKDDEFRNKLVDENKLVIETSIVRKREK